MDAHGLLIGGLSKGWLGLGLQGKGNLSDGVESACGICQGPLRRSCCTCQEMVFTVGPLSRGLGMRRQTGRITDQQDQHASFNSSFWPAEQVRCIFLDLEAFPRRLRSVGPLGHVAAPHGMWLRIYHKEHGRSEGRADFAQVPCNLILFIAFLLVLCSTTHELLRSAVLPSVPPWA